VSLSQVHIIPKCTWYLY